MATVDQLLDFHLEHDPDARTVTVTTLVDENGEQQRYVTVGHYYDGDPGPTVKTEWMLDRQRFEARCQVSVRLVESHAEVVHHAVPPGMPAIAYALRRRTPESRFAYLAEQRQQMVDRGADADELAVFDALAVAGWMGAA